MPVSVGVEEELSKVLGSTRLAVSVELMVNGERVGAEDVAVLRALQSTGSLLAASEALGVNYRVLWSRISSLERRLGVQLVRRTRGGLGGGRVMLTATAQLLVERFRVAERKASRMRLGEALGAELRIYGSDCPGVEVAASLLEERGVFAEYLRVGSIAGLDLLKRGYCHLAGVHVVDPETGRYNEVVVREGLALIRGYWREIGFMVLPGNPKNIYSPADLLRRNVVLANRNRGSGSYVLLEKLLKDLSSSLGVPVQALKRRIRGFETEYISHGEAGLAVLNGKADVAIGPRWTARQLGLDFVPLAKERFDFATRRELLKDENVETFVEVLRSKEFAEKAASVGLAVDEETGKVLVP